MSLQDDIWGKTSNLSVVDEIAVLGLQLKCSLYEPRKGQEEIGAFMNDFPAAFPDLNFWGAADLIGEGDYVVGQWEGGGTPTGPAFRDFLIRAACLPRCTSRDNTILKLKDDKILEEIGLDAEVTALTQLGLLRAV
jgi:hypothetical protein